MINTKFEKIMASLIVVLLFFAAMIMLIIPQFEINTTLASHNPQIRYKVTEGDHEGRWGHAWSSWHGLSVHMNVARTDAEIYELWLERKAEDRNLPLKWRSHLSFLGRSHITVWRWNTDYFFVNQTILDAEYHKYIKFLKTLKEPTDEKTI